LADSALHLAAALRTIKTDLQNRILALGRPVRMATESDSTRRSTFWRWPFKGRTAVRPLIIVAGSLTLLVCYRIASTPRAGEPFDVRSFVSFSIPDDQNAFTYYRQAKDRLVEESKFVPDQKAWAAFQRSYEETNAGGWSKANEQVRSWLSANQPALDLWKRGTECSKAMEIPPAELTPLNLPDVGPPRQLVRLALLQAARISAEGSPSAAWTWYRAVLRSSRHVAIHAAIIGRMVGVAMHATSVEPVLRWSARPELTGADLHLALADVLAIDEMTPPISDNLKAEYLFCRASLQGTTAGWSGLPLRLMGYPERVQDGLNLVYANWLSQADRPRFRRLLSKGGKWELFELDPATPPNLKVLSPAQIEDRVGLAQQSMAASTINLLIPSVTGFFESTDRERTRQAALVLGLALELYHREHGHFPAALDDLVKAGYLKSIPADPFGKGEPFHYRLEADPKQGAVLWSVWIDGIDQNGKIEAEPQREAGPGDKIFHIATPNSDKAS
jgi:hypothetical protein